MKLNFASKFKTIDDDQINEEKIKGEKHKNLESNFPFSSILTKLPEKSKYFLCLKFTQQFYPNKNHSSAKINIFF